MSPVGKSREQIPAFRELLGRSSPLSPLIAGKPRADISVVETTEKLPTRTMVVRRYTPRDEQERPRAVIVDFHGGGFVVGHPSQKDWYNSELAARLNAVVLSLGYRLGPEHRFPTAHQDAVEGYEWVLNRLDGWNLDPTRVVVGGDSAGANLATGVSLAFAGDARSPSAQVLLYPPTDLAGDYPSGTENAEAPFLRAVDSDAYLSHYCTREELEDPRMSPLRSVSLAHSAPAIIVCAEHDPFRDQGPAYAATLRAQGVPARATVYPGTAHGFMGAPGLYPASRMALADIVSGVRAIWSRQLRAEPAYLPRTPPATPSATKEGPSHA